MIFMYSDLILQGEEYWRGEAEPALIAQHNNAEAVTWNLPVKSRFGGWGISNCEFHPLDMSTVVKAEEEDSFPSFNLM